MDMTRPPIYTCRFYIAPWYPQYPEYPEYSQYPQYPEYPEYSQYPGYPEYPEYPNIPRVRLGAAPSGTGPEGSDAQARQGSACAITAAQV